MVLIVLRHGKSIWNQENRFTGFEDVKLCDQGKEEANYASELLKNIHFDVIFSSDLFRTIETAQVIAKDQKYKQPISQIVDFKERDYGDLTGKNKTELMSEYGETQVKIWRRSYYSGPPNGENLDDVVNRVARGYADNNIHKLLQANKNVIIVAHGNSLRALFVFLGLKTIDEIEEFEINTGIPIKIDVDNKDYSYVNDYQIFGHQIIDSRGNPTIEVQCCKSDSNKTLGKGSSPSGASCGSTEVCELRDGDKSMFHAKSVYTAVDKISELNKKMILNKNTITDLIKCDQQFNNLDGTEMKTNYGGNTSTALSFCILNTAANLLDMEMYQYMAQYYGFEKPSTQLPIPLVNIINGGKHGVTEDLKIQEFMIFTRDNLCTTTQIRIYCEVYHSLKKILVEKYGEQAKSIGDEGGFCPPIYSAEEALNVIEEAITVSGYSVGEDVFIALDCAASEFYDEVSKKYEVEKDTFLTGSELVDYYGKLIENHPALKSIEDGFHETDYNSWKLFTQMYSDKLMIVGDDLFTTNPKLIKQGLEEQWANTLLLKVNQIGTITEAVNGAKMMMDKGNNVIVSHRSGETNHAYIVDIAIGIGAKYLKIGSPCRGERVAKFNRLLEIEHQILRKMC
jgi:enolase